MRYPFGYTSPRTMYIRARWWMHMSERKSSDQHFPFMAVQWHPAVDNKLGCGFSLTSFRDTTSRIRAKEKPIDRSTCANTYVKPATSVLSVSDRFCRASASTLLSFIVLSSHYRLDLTIKVSKRTIRGMTISANKIRRKEHAEKGKQWANWSVTVGDSLYGPLTQ